LLIFSFSFCLELDERPKFFFKYFHSLNNPLQQRFTKIYIPFGFEISKFEEKKAPENNAKESLDDKLRVPC